MGKTRNEYKIFVGKLEGREFLEVLGAHGRNTLKWILQKQGGKVWTGFMWLRIGASCGLL
jgi:hypothetical protein